MTFESYPPRVAPADQPAEALAQPVAAEAPDRRPDRPSKVRAAARVVLGLGLATMGVAHLTVARQPFKAQVPETLAEVLPASMDDIVLGSGVIEIGLGAALAGLPKERRRVGTAAAAYFVAIFPGNISQLLKHEDAFGLDTDQKRVARLFFQPVLVLWSLFAGEVI